MHGGEIDGVRAGDDAPERGDRIAQQSRVDGVVRRRRGRSTARVGMLDDRRPNRSGGLRKIEREFEGGTCIREVVVAQRLPVQGLDTNPRWTGEAGMAIRSRRLVRVLTVAEPAGTLVSKGQRGRQVIAIGLRREIGSDRRVVRARSSEGRGCEAGP